MHMNGMNSRMDHGQGISPERSGSIIKSSARGRTKKHNLTTKNKQNRIYCREVGGKKCGRCKMFVYSGKIVVVHIISKDHHVPCY